MEFAQEFPQNMRNAHELLFCIIEPTGARSANIHMRITRKHVVTCSPQTHILQEIELRA